MKVKVNLLRGKAPPTKQAGNGEWSADGEAFRKQQPVALEKLPVLVMPMNRRPLLSRLAKAMKQPKRRYVTLPLPDGDMAVLVYTV